MAQTGLQFTLQLTGAEDLALAVTKFKYTEHLSQPFELTVTFASRDTELSAEDWLDREASFTIWQRGDVRRHLHGVVCAFRRGDPGHRRTYYDVVIRPAIRRLGLFHDCRLFQDLSAQTIITQLCHEVGITDVTWAVTRELPVREYTVQYRETTLAYLERLAASEGLVYFHEFEGDAHRLVFTDDPQALPRLGERPYHSRAGGSAAAHHVHHLQRQSRISPASATLEDWYFKKPAYRQHHTQDTDESRLEGQRANYTHYDWHGGFKADEPGRRLTRYRLEHLRGDALVATGKSDLAELRPGVRFDLTGHDRDDMNRDWQVIGVVHEGTQPQAAEEEAINATSGATTYGNTLTLTPGDQAWRTDPTPKPRVHGPQMATVVGPEGEEIYVDEFGRVKVRFHWDRDATPDEAASAWIRVAQGWAGSGYGVMAIPRIGMAVIVDHLEADPDQPIIISPAYHATNVPPYALPEHKTRTVIKTKTHLGSGSNELRFEDANGAQQIYLHAERDLDLKVKHDRSEEIGHDRHLKVHHDRISEIEHDDHLSVQGERRTEIHGDDHHIVRGTHHEKAERALLFEGGQHVHLKAGAKLVLEAGGGWLRVDGSGVTYSPTLTEAGGGSAGGMGQQALPPNGAVDVETTPAPQALERAIRRERALCPVCEEG